jgi:putative flippase GtrA
MAKKQRKQLLVQFVEYMVTGGVWFWSGYILIVLLDGPLGLFWANMIGNGVGITLNFILNRLWVFKTSNTDHLHETAGRYIVYTFVNAFLLNYGILYMLREKFDIDPAIGQFIASAFFTGWNFFWYRVWVFKGDVQPKSARKAVIKKRR